MNQIPPLSIDFKKINAFTSERDLKLWKQEATAKYCKSSYEEIRKQNEMLDKKINKCEQSIKETEEEIPKLKALNERIATSISTASTVTNYLIQLGIYVENEIVAIKDRYEKMIHKYSNMYKDKRKSLEQSNVLYKELEAIRNRVESGRIEKEVLYRFIEDKQKMIKIKENVNKQLENSEIIKFAKAVINLEEYVNVNKELAEQREIAQNLVKLYEKQYQSEENSQLQNVTKGKELPKLSSEITGIEQLAKFKIPKISTIEVPQTKPNITKNEELKLLNELKQRSNQRKKIIQEKQTAFLTSKMKRSQELPPVDTSFNTSTTIITNVEETENTVKPPSNVVILQNETIDTGNHTTLNKMVPKKRPSNDLDTTSKLKKTKKVTFRNCFSPEDQTSKTTINEEVKNKNEEVSSYFSKVDNVNMYEPPPSFLNSMDEFMPSQDFYQEDYSSGNLMTSKDDEKSLELSSYKSPDNSQLITHGLF